MSSRDDALAARTARQVQKHAPTYLVFWSLRNQRFEAWELTDPARCRIVHAAGAGELWDLMQQVNLDLWRTRPHGDQPPTPVAADHPDPSLPVTLLRGGTCRPRPGRRFGTGPAPDRRAPHRTGNGSMNSVAVR
ncbi:hypothetical protein GCM10017559_21790 [Streptosporangium longisporum]|uniref:Uncharacterized protein n=1 Tax=Streptosporangium longisporum TaxID=46187 RepID=A0ABP6KC39_9ACTN